MPDPNSVYDVVLPPGYQADVFATADVLVEVTLEGPPGPAGGGSGTVLTYTLTAVSNWTQAHSFGYDPAVRLIDPSGSEVASDVSYPDSSHVNVQFANPFTGIALLS